MGYKNISVPGYARVLATLRTAMTREELKAAAGIGHTAAKRFIEVCHDAGRVHIARWEMPARTAPQPVWVMGRGTDAPCPSTRPNGSAVVGPPLACRRHVEHEPPDGLRKFLALLDAMERRPTAAIALAKASGLSLNTLRDTVAVMHTELGLCHVANWDTRKRRADKPGGARIALYLLGAGEDAPLPPTVPRSISNRKYRIRLTNSAMNAKVEILARKPGRYEVQTVPRFFSSLRIGEYLPADTAISRAYG